MTEPEWTCPKNETPNSPIDSLGKIAQEIGLISGIEAVKLNQKVCEHCYEALLYRQNTKAQCPGTLGNTPVTTDLPAWFGKYNARQTIDAGIKETKQVFYLHRLKVPPERPFTCRNI